MHLRLEPVATTLEGFLQHYAEEIAHGRGGHVTPLNNQDMYALLQAIAEYGVRDIIEGTIVDDGADS